MGVWTLCWPITTSDQSKNRLFDFICLLEFVKIIHWWVRGIVSHLMHRLLKIGYYHLTSLHLTKEWFWRILVVASNLCDITYFFMCRYLLFVWQHTIFLFLSGLFSTFFAFWFSKKNIFACYNLFCVLLPIGETINS